VPSKRYYSDTDRTRRAGGALLVVVGLLILALLLRLALGGVSTALAVLVIVPLLLIGIGARFLRHVVAAFDVDLGQRRYSLIRDGKPAGGGALDELGPLRVTREETTVVASNPEAMDRTYVRYKVKPAGFGFFSFHSLKSPRRARRKMEALARKWRLSCRSLDGPVRAYEHLDAPLHVRLRDDREARTPVTLDPDWRVTVGEIFRGHAMVSRHRSFAPLLNSAVYALFPALLLFFAGGGLLSEIRRMLHDTPGQVLVALGTAVAGVVAWKILHGLLDTFRPGTITIDDRGVAYRWSRLKFDRIEEVTVGQRIEIVGDRRVLAIAESFCPHEARKTIAHELQRLIVETATKRGL
jgi:hypothetical protein